LKAALETGTVWGIGTHKVKVTWVDIFGFSVNGDFAFNKTKPSSGAGAGAVAGANADAKLGFSY